MTPDEVFDREIVPGIKELTNYARALTKDPDKADDLLANVSAKAWRYRDSYEPGTNSNAWLMTITKREHIDTQRKAIRQNEVLLSQVAWDLLPANDSSREQFEMSHDLGNAMQRMNPDFRQVLIEVFWNGLEYQEVADKLGIAKSTVGTRVLRGKEQLREIMGSNYGICAFR